MENSQNGIQTAKQILYPIKILAFNQQIAFCCVISQSMIIYTAGSNLILENIRNHQQNIIWVSQSHLELQCIFKYENSCGQLKIALILKNIPICKYVIKIFDIDWNSYFHHANNGRTITIHQLQPLNSRIKACRFDRNGENMAIIQQKFEYHFLTFYCLNENKIISSCQIDSNGMEGLKSFSFDSDNYFVLYDQTSVIFYVVTCKYSKEVNKISQYKICETEDQKIQQIQFDDQQREQVLIFILTSKGRFKIGCLKNDSKLFQKFQSFDVTISNLTQTGVSSSQYSKQIKTRYNPSAFVNHGNKIVFGYRNCQKIAYLTYSLLNYSQHTLTISDNILYNNKNLSQYNGINKSTLQQQTITVSDISASGDNCIYAFTIINDHNIKTLMIIDTLQSLASLTLLQVQSPANKIFGNSKCHGECYSVAYLELSSGLFVLYQDNYSKSSHIAYYCIDYSKIVKISPNSILQWTENLKIKTLQLQAHQLNNVLALIHEQTVKIHFYSKQRLQTCYATLNVPNCQCCTFTPLGEKMLLANYTGIFIANANTFQSIAFIPNTVYLYRIPKKFMKITNFRTGIELASGNNSYLYEINQFQSTVNFMGTFQSLETKGEQEDKQHNKIRRRSQVLAADQSKQLILQAQPKSQQIRFLNFKLDRINALSISVQCFQLYQQIDILLIGTTQGELYLCKWPQIIHSTTKIDSDSSNKQIIGALKIHSCPIISLKFTSNYRYIYTISQNGQIGITEFLQQHSMAISRAASLLLLKKSNNKPICGYTITSKQTQNKRAEAIVKAIGKQAKISHKNQQVCSKLNIQLLSKIHKSKTNLQAELKSEIQRSEQQQRAKQLIVLVKQAKLQLQQLQTKGERTINQTKQQNIKQLQQIFMEKTKLEETYTQYFKKCQQSKNKQKQQLQEDDNHQTIVFGTQVQLINQGFHSNRLLFKQYSQLNHKISVQLQEDQQEDKIIFKDEYQLYLKQLKTKKNDLTVNIRKLTYLNSELREKSSCFNVRCQELSTQLTILKQMDPLFHKNYSDLDKRLKETKQINTELINQHRLQQLKKQQTYSQATNSQKTYNYLCKQLEQIERENQKVQNTQNKLEDDCFKENNKKIQLNQSINNMKKKIKILKIERDKIKRKCYGKTAQMNRSFLSKINSPSHHTRQEHQRQVEESQTDHLNDDEEQFDNLLNQRQKFCGKISRMNTIKNQKIKKCVILNDKLIDDSKKLTMRLNELRRYNEHLAKKEEKLILQIKNGSLDININKNRNIDNWIGNQIKDQIRPQKLHKNKNNTVHFHGTNKVNNTGLIQNISKNSNQSLHQKNVKFNIGSKQNKSHKFNQSRSCKESRAITKKGIFSIITTSDTSNHA